MPPGWEAPGGFFMRVDAFDYELPDELIAQAPCEPRDASRLLMLPRGAGAPVHRAFRDLPSFLRAGDVLVVNDTRVMPARLQGWRAGGGAAEVLLLRPAGDGRWHALVRPAGRLGPGRRIMFGEEGPDGPPLAAVVEDRLPEGEALVRFEAPGGAEATAALLRGLGRTPLPPYIKGELSDPERYQTVYGRAEGSVAAPTAGLHFTPAILAAVAAAGVTIATVTLHVGPGTFRPVRAERVEEHRMHAEYYSVPPATAGAVAAVRARGGRVIAVGTTAARTLEAAALAAGDGAPPAAGEGWTDLFIHAGYRFRVVDGLLTNFHLPCSTLLMLVCAFAGRERVLAAYAEAVRQRYRFYSFGDAMLIM